MNGAQQIAHTRKTDDLDARLATVETIVEALGETTLKIPAAMRVSIGEERTHRLKLADEQRAYVDGEDRKLRVCCQERWDAASAAHLRLGRAIVDFRSMTLWQRLRWLVTGF